jgi:hypothetical protein
MSEEAATAYVQGLLHGTKTEQRRYIQELWS